MAGTIITVQPQDSNKVVKQNKPKAPAQHHNKQQTTDLGEKLLAKRDTQKNDQITQITANDLRNRLNEKKKDNKSDPITTTHIASRARPLRSISGGNVNPKQNPPSALQQQNATKEPTLLTSPTIKNVTNGVTYSTYPDDFETEIQARVTCATVAINQIKAETIHYNIFYVDYGVSKLPNISRIFRLESPSTALSKFPRQAIRVKVHNLPPVCDTIVARLRGLPPPESPTIVKIALHGLVPQVIIYRRSDTTEGIL